MNSFVKIFQETVLAPGNNYFMGLIQKKLSNQGMIKDIESQGRQVEVQKFKIGHFSA